MKNNQFKKVIRTKIEEACAARKLQCIYVDSTSNDRQFYIYDENYRIEGQLSLYLDKSTVRLRQQRARRDKENHRISITNYDKQVHASYMRFEDVIEFIDTFMESIVKLKVEA